ncbi:MAG: hypothetical protein V4792_12190 [Pseudomonadota bacterium]
MRDAVRTRALLLLLGVLTLASIDASAIPVYRRQTGQSCAACHTAPPELTPFGRRFMLNGFTMSGGKTGVPLSGYVEAAVSSTQKALPTARPGLDPKDNAELQRVKALAGGAITDSIGGFGELVYDGVAERLRLGNVDLRYADSTAIGGHDVVYGLTLHNNPGFQDPWSSTLARTWPFTRSSGTPQPRNAALLEGLMAQRVVGLGGYSFVDDRLYLELGVYRKLSRDAQSTIGVQPGDTRSVEGTAVYARVAHEASIPGGSLTVGASLLDTDLGPPGGLGTGTAGVRNVGLDALLHWGRGPQEFTLRGAASHERWSLGSSVAQGLATNARNRFDNLRLSASYLYAKRYSAAVGVFRRSGSTDPLFFGTANGKPDSAGIQLDGFIINPFFPPPPWHPDMRTRIGVGYTHYTRFDGAKSNYDGSGRDASDNDTVFLYLLWAF